VDQPPLGPPRYRLYRWARRRWRLATAALAAVLLAGGATAAVAAAAVAASAQVGQPSSVAALSANWYESAPYYSTLDSDAPDLGQVMAATGQKAFDMAFILADGSSCSPAWDGTDPVSSDTQVASVISEVRSDGGDVTVSAGGYDGTKLGQVCGSASATAAAYQQVITTYGLHAFDFDLEEPEIENSSAIANELGAAQILQQEDPGLFISITMPSIATGANYFGQQLMDEALAIGFTPNDYTIMPFDGGFNGGSAQVTALQDFNAQLVATFGWSSSVAYAHEGFSGMNGRTDDAEYFYQSDFQTVLKLVTEGTLGRIVLVNSRYDRFRPFQRQNTWKEVGGAANGLLFDLGPHLLDQALALFGAPKSITAGVAMAVTEALGGAPPLTAVLVIAICILGAARSS